jgi:hypothetical protein
MHSMYSAIWEISAPQLDRVNVEDMNLLPPLRIESSSVRFLMMTLYRKLGLNPHVSPRYP